MIELADVVVVGGGVLGLALTEALCRRFSRVRLVDAARCGSRATAGGFAWVNASSKWQNEAYYGLNAEACRLHLALASEFGAARTVWNGGGSLRWVRQRDHAAMADLTRQFETLQAWNYPVVRTGRGEMQALEPYAVFEEDAVGMFCPSEGWISSQRLCRYYGERAREHHATISEFTQVTGFSLDHRGAVASVETSAGRIATRVVVLCAGVETGNLASLLLGHENPLAERILTRSPGLLAECAPPVNARVHRVCYPAGAGGFHLRPTTEGGLLLGADDTDTAAQAQTAVSVSPAIAENAASAGHQLSDRAAGVLPQFDRNLALSTRICVRPVPSDGLPVAGELPGVPGAYLLVSHSGITLGPLLGQLLAEEILTGRLSPWLAPYRPSRFAAAMGRA